MSNFPPMAVAELCHGKTETLWIRTTWYGVLASAGTPKDIVARLNREIVRIMNAPDTKERLAVVAADPMTSSPEQFAAYIKQEIAKWSKVVRTAGLRAD